MGRDRKVVGTIWQKTIVSGGTRSRASIADKLFPALDKSGIEYIVNPFVGETCLININKLVDMCKEFKPDFIIGTGGGKSLDTAKYAAELYGVPVVTIPTIAATCAASSNQIIVYSDEGEYLENVYPKTNPPLVITDPEVIVNAPIEYFISGIYDSLAKWYEGSASLPGSDNADVFDYMALSIAKMLKNTIYEEAAAAMEAIKKKEINKEFIDITNLNIYTASTVQALGIKAVRNGIAHSIQNGLTLLEGSHDVTHGEKVAYGIAVQLNVLHSLKEEMDELIDLYKKLGLTPTFKGLNLKFTEETVRVVAHKAVTDVLMAAKPFELQMKLMHIYIIAH